MTTLKQQFSCDPRVNPVNGEKVKIGGCKYKKLTAIYGDVKIISPVTGNKIAIGKGEYKKLINSGEYTEDDLLKLIKVNEYVKSPLSKKMIIKEGKTYNKLVEEGLILTSDDEDFIKNKLLNMTIKNVNGVCQANHIALKIGLTPQFWKEFYEKNDVPYIMTVNPEGIEGWIEAYMKTKKAMDITNKLVNNIIDTKHLRSFKVENLIREQCDFLNINKLKKINDVHFHIKMPKEEQEGMIQYSVSIYYKDDIIGKNKMNRQDFELILTKLFFNVDKVTLTNNKYTLTYNKLQNKNGDKNVKECFPNW